MPGTPAFTAPTAALPTAAKPELATATERTRVAGLATGDSRRWCSGRSERGVDLDPHGREHEEGQSDGDERHGAATTAPPAHAAEGGEGEAGHGDDVEDRELFRPRFERGKQHRILHVGTARNRSPLPAAYPRPYPKKRIRTRRSGSELAVEDAAGDVVHLDPIVHRLLLQEPPRLLFGGAVLVHQYALGAVDRLPFLAALGQIADVPLERCQLRVAPERHLDRGDEVTLLERLDQVRERARVAGLLDEIALGEGGEDQHRGQPLARDVARRGEAVHTGHLDVEDHEVGMVLADELDGFVT